MDTHVVELYDLTRLDQLELQKRFGREQMTFESAAEVVGSHGELTTLMAIAIVSLVSLFDIGVWAAKNRKKIIIRHIRQSTNSAGDSESDTTEFVFSGSESDAEVIKRIGEAIKGSAEALGASG